MRKNNSLTAQTDHDRGSTLVMFFSTSSAHNDSLIYNFGGGGNSHIHGTTGKKIIQIININRKKYTKLFSVNYLSIL